MQLDGPTFLRVDWHWIDIADSQVLYWDDSTLFHVAYSALNGAIDYGLWTESFARAILF